MSDIKDDNKDINNNKCDVDLNPYPLIKLTAEEWKEYWKYDPAHSIRY